MPKTLALITLHGMGRTPRDYHAGLIARLGGAMGRAAWDRVAFRPVYYQDELQGSQAEVFARMRGHIDWMKLREFLLYGFSDAASLEYRKERTDSPYWRTQQAILRALDAAFDDTGRGPAPVVVIAQSLGCHVISSYLWDAQQPAASAGIWQTPPGDVPTGAAQDRFRRMRTLQRLYTTGCNIPIFVAGHRAIEAITPPCDGFRWLNFFDEDDVLGWPLRPLSPSYARLVEDIPINAGGGLLGTLAGSWNPLSHTQYWDDAQVIRHLAASLEELV